MAKKTYTTAWMDPINPEDPVIIEHGGSQGTSGYDSMWTFEEGFDEGVISLIELNCDDYDLQDMDADGDYTITWAEFQAWFEANEPW